LQQGTINSSVEDVYSNKFDAIFGEYSFEVIPFSVGARIAPRAASEFILSI
jgi:hypothetical protein